MSAKVWDIKQLAIIFGVVPISSLGGYGEDDTITWKQSEDSFGTKVGADGTVTRFANNAKLAEIELTTMQTSPVNALLSGVLQLDTSVGGGAGIMPFSILDLQGTTLLVCSDTWIAGPPECPFGKSAQERKWKLNGVIASILVGGN
jgi:hypothetical protein